MDDDWEVASYLSGDTVLPPFIYLMRNKETGETRRLIVNTGQSVGDAVRLGQWVD